MNCGSCLSKLQPILDSSEDVFSWTADLADERKLVFVETSESFDSDQIVKLIGGAGFDAQPVDAEPTQSTMSGGDDSDQSESGFQLATYRPLFLVVAYVIAAASLLERAQPEFDLMRWMSYFMGFFFLGFAFFKLLDVGSFAKAFSTYDVIAKRSTLYGLAYPWIELGLGVLFVTQTWLPIANVVTALVMAIGLVGVVGAVRRKETIQCACLGTAFNLPMSVVTIIENSVMLVMAIVMLLVSLSS
jgi:cation transport ATPase